MYPSVITTFNIVSPTDRLNSPSHSALHNSVSSVVTQIETFVGKEGATSTVGTLVYDVRSPASNGGGHVQTANKGGTGQTTFTKGDLLVATSASTISKLSVSSTLGDVLQADPSQAAGVRWGGTVANKIVLNTASVFMTGGASSVTTIIFAASIIGSTLGTNNAMRFTGLLPAMRFDNSTAPLFVVNYGSNVVASVTANTINVGSVLSGTLSGMIFANGISNQIGYVQLLSGNNNGGVTTGAGIILYNATGSGNSSINSSADQTLTITAKSGTGSGTSILSGPFIVEKIS